MKIRILPAPPSSVENGAWDSVRQGWRQVFGNYQEQGFSIENHQFWTPTPLDWQKSFHPGSLEICFNFSGYGRIGDGRRTLEFFPRSAGFYLPGKSISEAIRAGGEKHHFVTLEFSPAFLRQHLQARLGDLRPEFQRFLQGTPSSTTSHFDTLALTPQIEAIARALVQPPVPPAAWPLWFDSKIVELLCAIAFAGETEHFCARIQRVTRQRVEQVIEILRENLNDPLSLAEIGRLAGCSPFHLSRIFSAETGQTIPQYLRQLRMERAAELLRSGRFNVTETALEVGYSSLSHFSKSYAGVFGHLPKDGTKARLAG